MPYVETTFRHGALTLEKHTWRTCEKREVAPSDRRGKSFFTADVEALYTNINVETAINDIIEFAVENRTQINLCGLKLTDIHELLEESLLNSYFVYDRKFIFN